MASGGQFAHLMDTADCRGLTTGGLADATSAIE